MPIERPFANGLYKLALGNQGCPIPNAELRRGTGNHQRGAFDGGLIAESEHQPRPRADQRTTTPCGFQPSTA